MCALLDLGSRLSTANSRTFEPTPIFGSWKAGSNVVFPPCIARVERGCDRLGHVSKGDETEIDALFQLSPPEFVSARNALVAQLKKAGRDEVASVVKSLPKPSISAWTVNQLIGSIAPPSRSSSPPANAFVRRRRLASQGATLTSIGSSTSGVKNCPRWHAWRSRSFSEPAGPRRPG